MVQRCANLMDRGNTMFLMLLEVVLRVSTISLASDLTLTMEGASLGEHYKLHEIL